MTPTLFYGYPVPKPPYGERDPVRPWWVRQGMIRHWIRSDGLTAVSYTGKEASVSGPQLEELEEVDVPVEGLLAYCDRTWPMPVPPVLLGQVWWRPSEMSVDGGWFERVELALGADYTKCVLVWGPFAPWAPPDWTPPTPKESTP